MQLQFHQLPAHTGAGPAGQAKLCYVPEWLHTILSMGAKLTRGIETQ